MTIRRWLLALVAAAGFAFVGGLQCRTGVKVDARTVALQAALDASEASFATAQAQRVAQARQDSLWIESVTRAAAQTYAKARWLKAQRQATVARLPADTTCTDSLATVTEALAAETGRADALDSTVILLDSAVARAVDRGNAEAARADAAETRLALTETVNAGLNAAIKRARVPRVLLTIGPGYGFVYSGGRFMHGPGAQVSLAVPIRLPWPFR